MKMQFTTMGYIILGVVILTLFSIYLAIRPFRITSSVTPKDFGVPFENVSFRTRDNIEIKGWFIPSEKPQAKTIILLHGYPADKGDILPSRLFLHDSYNLLLFDFRYFGESGGHYSTLGKNEVLDLLAAIDYLHSRGIHTIGVWGFSFGGSVALMTAAQTTGIKALIAESSYARLDWMTNEYYKIPLLRYVLAEITRLWVWILLGYDINSVSPAQAAEKIVIPVLLIHSKNDVVVPFRHALLLQQSFPHDAKLDILFSDTKHGESFEHYENIIKEFFDKNL